MPNIEIKARCCDLNRAKSIAQMYHTEYLGILHQVDTYFTTRSGRLKLREINGETAQLLPYMKNYKSGPMKSDYAILPVANAKTVKELFTKLLGIEFVVDKQREVFLIDNVRIHLDRVAGLGNFVEFEAVCATDSDAEIRLQTQKVQDLMKIFEIKSYDLVDRSYVDFMLLESKNKASFHNSAAT